MADKTVVELNAADPELDALREALRRSQRDLARAKARKEDLVEAVLIAARDAAVLAGRPTIATVAKDRRRHGEEVALLHATDWQGGKVTVSFSLDVLAERIRLFANKVTRITDAQRADHPVRRCVLMLGGDMVEGVNIFPGQAWEVDATLYEQLFTVARIVEQLIVDLLAAFEHVDVVCEWGNHGRIGRKGEFPAIDNVDLILYRMLAERSSDARVTWQYGTDWYQIVEIGNYKALLVHGDEIGTYSAHPVYAISGQVHRWKVGALPNREQFSDCYQGHRHRSENYVLANGDYVYLTGSPESGNQYASQHLAAMGRPAQRLHYVDPGLGRVTAEYTVWLD